MAIAGGAAHASARTDRHFIRIACRQKKDTDAHCCETQSIQAIEMCHTEKLCTVGANELLAPID